VLLITKYGSFLSNIKEVKIRVTTMCKNNMDFSARFKVQSIEQRPQNF
jgi:hypothetical protein